MFCNSELHAARLERSSFCYCDAATAKQFYHVVRNNKKAGVEGGNSCHKKSEFAIQRSQKLPK